MTLPVPMNNENLFPARRQREIESAFNGVVLRGRMATVQIEAEQYVTERVIDALCDTIDYAQRRAGDDPIKGQLVSRAVMRAASKLDSIQRSF